jgi:hypothetical protein
MFSGCYNEVMENKEKIEIANRIGAVLKMVGLESELSGVEIEDARHLLVWHPDFDRSETEQWVDLSDLSSGKETPKTILSEVIMDLRNSAQDEVYSSSY